MSVKVAIIMGSHSDWETMRETESILKEFGVSFHKEIVSAHRSPEYMLEFSKSAKQNGYSVIIAGAGGAAHLPGMVASMTTLPVLGVPIQSKTLNGLDSLLSIVQMPGGVPVGTLAIGVAGARNAGLLAIRILSLQDSKLSEKLEQYRNQIREDALSKNKDLL
ncbi:5-(carboxyamino)imidazole ribonucleotide mutase [Leptospira mayottensis]|uniref:N5-carboxyaminoimidazole ribonucleotide mutase n=2 Tax=Leptospira mayottensis TaxID=1137606 RepID=A0AA87SY44_9LEPT|nr:5-(carboxyamino)imidazole ribonucleotide mutase [Leptospira mayottensis]AXR61863.1 5-(carboxyamino)imidazole ribonucleotide mutase [Leptospira mayottensis]AXR65776.1 5-(carboxyamino)imidazole ribonucleotide mutase [Leptospira mayottensis]AZQ01687.1 5-(carboxyamino)imidazole ribonucleotide mutase [Leptospira mayottensis 200901116]EKS01728.1 phosphoribosylaminoimidazole carboxylase, catalytic subunit [Leptospira mayottensis 200901122]TGM95385.1 5-(carboxyamino)imidazole ribonucleotide mutase 